MTDRKNRTAFKVQPTYRHDNRIQRRWDRDKRKTPSPLANKTLLLLLSAFRLSYTSRLKTLLSRRAQTLREIRESPAIHPHVNLIKRTASVRSGLSAALRGERTHPTQRTNCRCPKLITSQLSDKSWADSDALLTRLRLRSLLSLGHFLGGSAKIVGEIESARPNRTMLGLKPVSGGPRGLRGIQKGPRQHEEQCSSDV